MHIYSNVSSVSRIYDVATEWKNVPKGKCVSSKYVYFISALGVVISEVYLSWSGLTTSHFY
jgi:hypothetical protein